MLQGGAAVRRQLREAGLRVTGPRQAVLEWLAEHPHATVDQIGRGVRERSRSVSTQAVYDVLSACAEAGLVRWVEPAGHPARYECRTGDNHHHLVCQVCGRIDDVDCVVGAQPCLNPVDHRSFAVDEAEVVFWGVCFECSSAAGSSATSPSVDPSSDEEVRE